MAVRQTLPIIYARLTNVANRTGPVVNPNDILAGVVKAFNHKEGRNYEQGAPEALFDAVKAFNSRRRPAPTARIRPELAAMDLYEGVKTGPLSSSDNAFFAPRSERNTLA